MSLGWQTITSSTCYETLEKYVFIPVIFCVYMKKHLNGKMLSKAPVDFFCQILISAIYIAICQMNLPEYYNYK